MFFRGFPTKEVEDKEFDFDLFEEEKNWLEKRKNGELATSKTSVNKSILVFTSIIFSFFIGGSIGVVFGVFFKNQTILILSPIITYVITFAVLNKTYSTTEFCVKDRIMMYEGSIQYAGEDESVRYRGPIEVINATQVVKKKRSKKYYIRFATNSGYMRSNYKPEKERDFLDAVELLGLFDLNEVNSRIANNSILRHSNGWDIIYEIKFDRSEFIEKLKEEKRRKEVIMKKLREEKRGRVLKRSNTKKKKK